MKIVLKINKIDYLHLFLCLFCISWLNRGLAAQGEIVNFVIFISAFAAWFLFALSRNNRLLKISNLWVWIYGVLIWIYSFFHTSIFNFMSYASVYMVILMIFYDYYAAEEMKTERKIILAYYLFENLLIAARTAFVCFMDPMFSRNITASKENMSGFQDILIARFANIYTYAMLAVLLLVILPKVKHKVLCGISAAVFMICVYYSNYSTALIVMLLFLVCIAVFRKPKWIVLSILLALPLFALLAPVIAQASLKLSRLEGLTDFIRGKLLDISNVLSGVGKGNGNNTLYSRTGYIKETLDVIRQHPLIGIFGRPRLEAEMQKIHNHNVWFDQLAYFGIIRNIPFVMVIYTWYQNGKKLFDRWKVSPLGLMLLLWVIYGFLNPVSRTANHEFLFLILPLFGQYYRDTYDENPEALAVHE